MSNRASSSAGFVVKGLELQRLEVASTSQLTFIKFHVAVSDLVVSDLHVTTGGTRRAWIFVTFYLQSYLDATFGSIPYLRADYSISKLCSHDLENISLQRKCIQPARQAHLGGSTDCLDVRGKVSSCHFLFQLEKLSFSHFIDYNSVLSRVIL